MFAPSAFAARRSTLAGGLTGLVVLLGNGNAPMNYPANHYRFHQDGSFRYYTGLNAPGLALALDADSGQSTLYGRDATMEDRVWDGDVPSVRERAGFAAIEHTGSPGDLLEAVRAAKQAGREVHVLPPYRGHQRLRLAALLDIAPDAVEPSVPLIEAVIAQRILKTDEEVEQIEIAMRIAAEMHATASLMAQPGTTEHEVAAAMEAVALAHGSHPSFPIILTTRGEVPHYHASGYALREGDLLLHDAGCVAPETGYCSDITRVSPVGGTFTDRQRAIVSLVKEAQEACIARCAPGVSFRDVHDLASRTLTTGLVEIGLLRGDVDEIVAAGAHAMYFTHGLGHPMGLDVHDLEGLGEDRVGYGDEATRSTQFGTQYLRFARTLRPGHVMTVEPGIYFNDALIAQWKAQSRHAEYIDFEEAERWIGFGGVRIEDDVLITEDGHRVLGPGIPKDLDEVEALVRAA
ncbi:MAG: aminopeptidase P family protein [Bacteroidota bacterium]